MNDLGHWNFGKPFNPDDWFGFVYQITNLKTKQVYIGKKQFRFTHTLPPLKGFKRVRKITKDSNWRTYTGSSADLNFDIKYLGKDRFFFEMYFLCSTKGFMTYKEQEMQFLYDVLRSKMKNGQKKYYNKTIGKIQYVPASDASELEKLNN